MHDTRERGIPEIKPTIDARDGNRPPAAPNSLRHEGRDQTRLLLALGRASREQPPALTRRHGIVNLSWIAVEELGSERGPRALDALVARGFLRRHARHPEIGRLTPAGTRARDGLHAAAA